jgi:hypothetical protein
MSDATNSGQLDLSLPQDGYVFTWNTTGGSWQITAPTSNPIQSVPVNNIIWANNYIQGQSANRTQQQDPNGGLELDLQWEDTQEKSKGCSCKKCKEFNEYAEPNMPDKTFMCYACRHGL